MRTRVVFAMVLFVFAYMVAGGFVFSALERGHEREVREHTRDMLSTFLGLCIQIGHSFAISLVLTCPRAFILNFDVQCS